MTRYRTAPERGPFVRLAAEVLYASYWDDCPDALSTRLGELAMLLRDEADKAFPTEILDQHQEQP